MISLHKELKKLVIEKNQISNTTEQLIISKKITEISHNIKKIFK